METTQNSETPSPPYSGVVLDHWGKMAKLKQWAGAEAMESLQDHQEETMRNVRAENAAVRRQWGKGEEAGEEADVRTTILGDNVHPTPIVMQSPPSPGMGTGAAVLAALLGASVPAAGVAGYVASQYLKPNVVAPVQGGQTDVNIGLGRIQDYQFDEQP